MDAKITVNFYIFTFNLSVLTFDFSLFSFNFSLCNFLNVLCLPTGVSMKKSPFGACNRLDVKFVHRVWCMLAREANDMFAHMEKIWNRLINRVRRFLPTQCREVKLARREEKFLICRKGGVVARATTPLPCFETRFSDKFQNIRESLGKWKMKWFETALKTKPHAYTK